MTGVDTGAVRGPTLAARLGIDRSVTIAFGCILLILCGGALYSREFLSPEYLLQQLQVGGDRIVSTMTEEQTRKLPEYKDQSGQTSQ